MTKVLTERDIFPDWPSERELKAELEQDIRRISRETGAKRVAQLEAERYKKDAAPLSVPKERSKPVIVQEDGTVVEKPKKVKVEKPKKPTKPDGYVTIGELAKLWGIEATDARAALRGSGLEKPAYGWAFAPKEVPKIKKICGVKK